MNERRQQIRKGARGRGFTLIEIMIVVGIIVILAGLTIAIGMAVRTNAARKETIQRLSLLDGAMVNYLGPPISGREPTDTADPGDQVTWVRALLAGGGSKLSSLPTGKGGANGTDTTILDSWGNAIRYIPSVTTNVAGTIQKKNGYFWSDGPDKTKGTADDLYSSTPM